MAEISIKMIKIFNFQYSIHVSRFLKENEKTLYTNLELSTLKLEKKSQLEVNKTCFNNDILPTYRNMYQCCEISIRSRSDSEIMIVRILGGTEILSLESAFTNFFLLVKSFIMAFNIARDLNFISKGFFRFLH